MKTLITKEERAGLKSGAKKVLENLATATSRNIKPIADGFTFLRKGLGKHMVDAGLKIGSVPAKTEPSEPSITFHLGEEEGSHESTAVHADGIKPESMVAPIVTSGVKVTGITKEKGDEGEVAE